MLYLFLALIVMMVALVFALLPNKLSNSGFKAQSALSSKEINDDLNSFLKQRFPIFLSIFRDNVLFALVVPTIVIFSFFAFFINPQITNVNFALILGLVMAATYGLRIFYHKLSSFRETLLSQIKQLFFNIRNQLSTGLSLDQALTRNLSMNFDPVLKKEFEAFMKVSQTNILEAFPRWLLRLQQSYRLPGLDEVAQVLSLELKYNNNQEEAFEKAIAAISIKVEQNSRQKNVVFISLTTIDFITLLFFGVMFFAIPGLAVADSTWWNSFRRELVVFISAALIWTSYFGALIYMTRRMA